MSDGSNGLKTGIHEPLLPPAFEVTDANRGAWALLAAEIMIVIAGLAVCVKLQMAVSTFRKFRLNDIALLIGLVLAIGYTIALCEAVRHGLGSIESILTTAQVRSLSQYYYASNILLYLSLAASKCSVALLIIDIQPRQWISVALYGLLAVVIPWGIAAVFVVALQCGPNRYVLGPTNVDACIDQYSAQIGLRIVDISTDVALAVLPAIMMAGVQVSTAKRLIVTMMFGIRLATPVLASVALASLRRFYTADTIDRPFEAVVPSIWTTMALNVSLITACLPSIKRFLTDWAAGITRNALVEPFELQHSTDRSRTGQTYGPRSFGKSQLRSNRSNSRSRFEHEIDVVGYSNYARGGEDDPDRADDGDSKKGLTDGIMHTIDYSIEYEQEQPQQSGSTISEGRRRVLHQ